MFYRGILILVASLLASECVVHFEERGGPVAVNDVAKQDEVEFFDLEATKEPVHICFSTDQVELWGVVAGIRSILANTAQPERIHYHVIVNDVPSAEAWLRKFFPADHGVNLDVRSPSSELHEHIHGMLNNIHHSTLMHENETHRNLTTLENVFNFVPFYMYNLLSNIGSRRLVYLDTDTLVTGDIARLHDVDLEGYPAAAVEDCGQQFSTYFSMELVHKTNRGRSGSSPPGFGSLNESTCVFNRGVFVMDRTRWKELKVTSEIEYWTKKYATKPGLYHGGVSQPPWLLALAAHGYKRLGKQWNRRGLGNSVPKMHLDAYHKMIEESVTGVTAERMKQYGVDYKTSVIFLDSDVRGVLHFNGANKPWVNPPCGTSYCTMGVGWRFTRASAKCPTEIAMGGGRWLVECSELWWSYFTRSEQQGRQAHI